MPPESPRAETWYGRAFARTDALFARETELLALSFLVPVALQILHSAGLVVSSPFGLLRETFPQCCLPFGIVFAAAGFPWLETATALAGGALFRLTPWADPNLPFLVSLLSGAGLLCLFWAAFHLGRRDGNSARARAFCRGIVPLLFTALVAPAGLELGRKHFAAQTYDGYLMHVESAVLRGPVGYFFFLSLGRTYPWILSLLSTVYAALNLLVALVIGLAIRWQYRRASIPLYLVLSGLVAGFVYGVMPVAGPRQTMLGTHGDVPFGLTALGREFVRNGMPSMHFGWAMAVSVFTLGMPSKALRSGVALFGFLTALSTLSTGEHYLVDLVVGAPFALAILACLDRGGEPGPRARVLGIFLAVVLFWYGGLMTGALFLLPPAAVAGLYGLSFVVTGHAATRFWGEKADPRAL